MLTDYITKEPDDYTEASKYYTTKSPEYYTATYAALAYCIEASSYHSILATTLRLQLFTTAKRLSTILQPTLPRSTTPTPRSITLRKRSRLET
jgi:hypothetical protein